MMVATVSTVRRLLWAVFVLGVVARIWGWRIHDVLHYDEYFQVLEPPHWRLTGAGMLTWEWNDGVRSWVLPGYHGAWMALLRSCGVRDGASIGTFLQLHWAVINASVVFIAFHGAAGVARRLSPARGGEVANSDEGWQAGIAAALLCALFPQLFLYAHHTLSENPATLCLVGALVAACRAEEIARMPAARVLCLVSGGLFSLGVGLKVAWAPLALVGPLVLLARGQGRLVAWMLLGAVPPVLLFGVVDLFTWGTFLGSFVKYLIFNFVEGKAAQFGVEPWHWYLKVLHERLPFTLPLLLVPALIGARATWPYLLSAFGLVAQLSTQGHKEERFVIIVWPLIIIAAAGVGGAWLVQRRRWPNLVAAVASAAAVLADGGVHAAMRGVYERAWLRAQAAAARDPDAVALMMESSGHTGGMLWFSGRGPVFGFDEALLKNDMITHVAVRRASEREQRVRDAGFVRVGAWGNVVLLKRTADADHGESHPP